jgi:hypothetical protein
VGREVYGNNGMILEVTKDMIYEVMNALIRSFATACVGVIQVRVLVCD